MFEDLQGKVLATLNDNWLTYKSPKEEKPVLKVGDYARWDPDKELHKVLFIDSNRITTHCNIVHINNKMSVVEYSLHIFNTNSSNWTFIPKYIVEGPFEEKLPNKPLNRFQLINL